MPVEYRVGDLFDQSDITALGHGVNCVGVMGAGIAPLFRSRWPEMFAEYRAMCLAGRLSPGNVFTWTAPDGTTIYNLATQQNPGRNATLRAIQASLTIAVDHARLHSTPAFAIPRIGAGLGGLHWPEVAKTIEQVATREVTIVVVSLPTPPQRHRW